MPVVSKDQAVKLLTSGAQKGHGADELLEVYNELFPGNPSTEEQAHEDVTPLVAQIVDHINSGLAIEEIVELWGLVFPRHQQVWYDEEEDRLHYNEEAEAVSTE